MASDFPETRVVYTAPSTAVALGSVVDVRDLEAALTGSKADADILLRSHAPDNPFWPDTITLMQVRDGRVTTDDVATSRESDRKVAPEGDSVLDWQLQLDADAPVTELARLLPGFSEEDGVVVMPWSLRNLDRTTAGFELLAKCLAEKTVVGPPRFGGTLSIDGAPYEVVVDESTGMQLQPLHWWLDDEAARALVRRHLREL